MVKVVLTGVVAGLDRSSVLARLAKLFKVTPEQVEELLRRPNYVLKAGLDSETAERYKIAIETAGATCMIKPDVPIESTLAVDLPPANEAAVDEAISPITAVSAASPAKNITRDESSHKQSVPASNSTDSNDLLDSGHGSSNSFGGIDWRKELRQSFKLTKRERAKPTASRLIIGAAVVVVLPIIAWISFTHSENRAPQAVGQAAIKPAESGNAASGHDGRQDQQSSEGSNTTITDSSIVVCGEEVPNKEGLEIFDTYFFLPAGRIENRTGLKYKGEILRPFVISNYGTYEVLKEGFEMDMLNQQHVTNESLDAYKASKDLSVLRWELVKNEWAEVIDFRIGAPIAGKSADSISNARHINIMRKQERKGAAAWTDVEGVGDGKDCTILADQAGTKEILEEIKVTETNSGIDVFQRQPN